jgi:hypothetical protein
MAPIIVLNMLTKEGLELIDVDLKESWLEGTPLPNSNGTMDEFKKTTCCVEATTQ